MTGHEMPVESVGRRRGYFDEHLIGFGSGDRTRGDLDHAVGVFAVRDLHGGRHRLGRLGGGLGSLDISCLQ